MCFKAKEEFKHIHTDTDQCFHALIKPNVVLLRYGENNDHRMDR